MSTSTAALLQEIAEVRVKLARCKLIHFTAYTFPTYEQNWHHVRMAGVLDDVLAGTVKRAIFCLPPQNGKSELVSRRFPAYVLGRRPDAHVIACSYNSSLANDMSRDTQRIIESEAYRRVFPWTKLASGKDSEVKMAAQFEVVNHPGSYRAAGVGGGITGKSMTIGIIDDPIKSRAEAESETYRKMVWNWYVSDFRTRAESSDTRIVIATTRWHTDDLAGRLLALAQQDPAADQWTVISFPALATQVRDGDPRQVGDALWPTRFSKAYLESTRIGSGVYDWSALYQQEPVPPGGAMGKLEWFKVVPTIGGVIRRCRCWDLAGTVATPGRDPDWTVGTLLGELTDHRWAVLHVVRVRTTSHGVDDLMLSTARTDGPTTLIREWQDPGAAGKAVIAAHRRMLAGFDYEGLPASGEKSLQWRPFLVQAEGGFVLVQQAPWNRAWLDELALVPYGVHDDQADSVAGAFNALVAQKSTGPTAAVIMPGAQSVSGPARQDWQAEYFRR